MAEREPEDVKTVTLANGAVVSGAAAVQLAKDIADGRNKIKGKVTYKAAAASGTKEA